MRANQIKTVLGAFTFFALAFTQVTFVAQAVEPAKRAARQTQGKADQIRYTFERHTFDVARQHGHVYFNNYWYSHPLTEQSQYVRLIEVFDQQHFNSNHEFFEWAKTLRGTRTYTYDTVKLHRPNSVTDLGPLVLLAPQERAEINPTWRIWREGEDARLAEQARMKRESELEKARQEAELANSRLLAQAASESAKSLSVLSGDTSLWEVELLPRNQRTIWLPSRSPRFSFSNRTPFGSLNFSVGSSKYVRAYGRNSAAAGRRALADHPNYRLGTVRKVAGF